MKKYIRKITSIKLRIIIRGCIEYLKAIVVRIIVIKNVKCTTETLRCEYNNQSKAYKYSILGGTIPICCASHLVELLLFIDKLARENNLSYFILYGTLLGAVRHNGGIIPWDTDADLCIDEKDADQIHKVIIAGIKLSNLPYYVIKNDKERVIKICYSSINKLHVDMFYYTDQHNNELSFDFFKCKKNILNYNML